MINTEETSKLIFETGFHYPNVYPDVLSICKLLFVDFVDLLKILPISTRFLVEADPDPLFLRSLQAMDRSLWEGGWSI